jgi:hypothetical protein
LQIIINSDRFIFKKHKFRPAGKSQLAVDSLLSPTNQLNKIDCIKELELSEDEETKDG